MARPAKYATEEERQQANARRQAELRQRTTRVDRKALEGLLAAVEAAAAAGDDLAQTVKTATPDSLLRNLARVFEHRAAELGEPPRV